MQLNIQAWLQETLTNCPLCNHDETAIFAEIEDKHLRLVYRECQNCGIVYQSPRIPEENLPTFYQQHYRQLIQGQPEPTKSDQAIQQKRSKHMAKFARQHITEAIQSHMDIGASLGTLMQAMINAFACQSFGIEPDGVYRQQAEKQGLSTYENLPAWQHEHNSRLDLVTLSHVLEHFNEPYSYLCNLRQNILRDGGYCLIEVPNIYVHRSFEIAHPFVFSPAVLRTLLHNAGFEVVAQKMHGYPHTMMPLYILMLAKASQTPSMSYETLETPKRPHIMRFIGTHLYTAEYQIRRYQRKIIERIARNRVSQS